MPSFAPRLAENLISLLSVASLTHAHWRRGERDRQARAAPRRVELFVRAFFCGFSMCCRNCRIVSCARHTVALRLCNRYFWRVMCSYTPIVQLKRYFGFIFSYFLGLYINQIYGTNSRANCPMRRILEMSSAIVW